MKYLRVRERIEWPRNEPWQIRLIRILLFFIPRANPDYDSKMYLVKSWLIEFIEFKGELVPWREIALDDTGKPVFAGPDGRNYGFWLDTNMKFEDFDGDIIEKDEFEHYWSMSGVKALELTKE
jgi:hypothetical protein